jgi:3-keto-disaccharide hydrolase
MIEKRRVLRHALWASAITCGLAMAAGVVMAAGGGLSRPGLIKVSVTDGAPSSAVALSAAPSAPGARVWTFDHDRGYQLPKDWTAVSGRWQVLTDFNAPSLPNTFGLAGYGLPRTKYVMVWIKSFFSNHYMVALPKDSTEYSDLTLQANFLPWGGAWGSYAGLIFRYENPKNYYVLVAACPKDYLGLYRMSDGKLRLIKKVSAPQLERGHWYSFKVVAQGGHFTGFLNGKQMLEAHDSGIAKGRIGVWSQNDSRINFDNIQVIAAQSAPAA